MSEPTCCHGIPRSQCAQCFNKLSMPVDAYLQALSSTGESARLFNPETVEEAAEKGIRNPTKPREPYLSGYRAGWNDALTALSKAAAGACATALVDAANSMMRK